jgi:hypothetical protein
LGFSTGASSTGFCTDAGFDTNSGSGSIDFSCATGSSLIFFLSLLVEQLLLVR